MKVRATITGGGVSAKLTVIGCGTLAMLFSAAISACAGPAPSTASASSSSAGPASLTPAVSAGSTTGDFTSASASPSASTPPAPVPGTVPTTGPPSSAAAQPTANSNCGTPVFFGLHGMGEGPSSDIPTDSPEIMGFDAAQNLISGAVLNVPVPYPTVSASYWDVLDAASAGPLRNAVNAGESALQSYVASWTSGCSLSQDKIALVGYSMGAWVINKWLKDHPGEWIMISAVVLYGDPCWKDGADAGLARIFNATGCSPAENYPYPGACRPCRSSVPGPVPVCPSRPGVRRRLWQRRADPADAGDSVRAKQLPSPALHRRRSGQRSPHGGSQVRSPTAHWLTRRSWASISSGIASTRGGCTGVRRLPSSVHHSP